MNDTPNLALPYILAAQAQKHVTHNEAIRALDCLVQLSVSSRTLTEPPAVPDDGSRYIVAPGAGGDWTGQDGKVAAWQDGAWAFYAPKDGWCAWCMNENALIVYEAAEWSLLSSGGDGGGSGDLPDAFDNLTHIGINTTGDTTNRLALKSPASLFDHEGAGHQQKINKKTAGDTASVLYQTNYSGRAEMGLAGDDDFHFKVSPNGSTWYEGLKIDRNTGRISFPVMGGPREVLAANRTYYVRTDGSDSNTGLANNSGGAFLTIQKAVDVIATLDLNGFNITIQLADGTYTAGAALKNAIGFAGAGSLVIRGNNATPANVVVSVTGGTCFYANGTSVIWTILDLKMQTSTSGDCLATENGGAIAFGNVVFGSCAGTHISAVLNGRCVAIGNYAISGGALLHLYAVYASLVRVTSLTVTVSGSPAFGLQFARAEINASIAWESVTVSGAATGARYYVATGSILTTNGAGASALPGNAAGTGTNFATSPYGLYA